ncbi:MAG: anti-sigma factor antagonist [Phycisphaerales bacterium]|nr:MAG: anti-sigma factor antagonist [Phycisphaerales bacterium]
MHDADQIEVQSETRGDAIIVRPIGDIDLSRAPHLREQLSGALQEAEARLVINLDDVPYMDSSGVATLVETMQMCRRSGKKLVLCQLQDRVRSIFEIARLDMVFTIVENTDEAINA